MVSTCWQSIVCVCVVCVVRVVSWARGSGVCKKLQTLNVTRPWALEKLTDKNGASNASSVPPDTRRDDLKKHSFGLGVLLGVQT